MKKIVFTLLFLPNILFAQIQVGKQSEINKNYFPIVSTTGIASIYYDANDFEAVKKTVQLFAADIERVTDKLPQTITSISSLQKNIIIIGTIGKNKLLDELIAAKKINANAIKNQWERYIIQTIENPLPGVQKALVIAGSDRRGTAYGTFSVSQAIGVSPWYWWADVPVQKSNTLYIKQLSYISKSPSVKYRGIFLNDEDWGLKPWASKNIDTDINDIGPRTYAKICELLLRLKANMVAPAMHSCTGAFYSHSENKVVADEYGIIITTSHCEPLLFNNAALSEWDTKRDGDWNYGTNKDVILKKLDNRIHEASSYENIYTVGLRGLHDEGMRGNFSREEKVNIVTHAITDQRNILEKYIHKQSSDIPQIYVPYKEALDVYNDGLQVPEDVTLVWTDDNYGYMKRLSNPEEQKRSGGSGVYYHISYLGPPHDYLWLCTTPPVLMYEELKKAYNTGANKYWLLNVGDIKPGELGIQTFMDLAWDVNNYNYTNINKHQSKFLANIFGAKYEQRFQNILDNYYKLAWSRKPEFMGWEREWDAKELANISNTDFSFQHYNEAQQRLADYQKLSDIAHSILNELPEDYRSSFFEMIGYPVIGAYQMNRKFLMAQLNHEKIKENNLTEANWAAEQSKIAYDSINNLSKLYNTILDGKWNGMMALSPGYLAKYQNMPPVTYTDGAGETPVDLTIKKEKLESCTVINLKNFKNKISKNNQTLRLIDGIGYDWNAVQLGEATAQTENPKDFNSSHFDYEFSGVNADSVTVYVYSVPFFPLHKSKSTTFGISVDKQPAFVTKNEPKEFSKAWKDQVLQNGTVAIAKFHVNKSKEKHTLSLICGDPGTIIEKVVIDWGGLKKSYIGPSSIKQ